MRWLNAQDHRWMCIEDENNPLQIGALLFLEAKPGTETEFVQHAIEHLRNRLPLTPWQVRYQPAPLAIDSGAWVSISSIEIGEHINPFHTANPLTKAELCTFVTNEVLNPLPKGKPPFRITLFDNLAPDLKQFGSVAMMIQHHHAVADGIGFQNVIELLTDPMPESNSLVHSSSKQNEHVPSTPMWIAKSLWRSVQEFQHDRANRNVRHKAKLNLQELKSTSTYKRQRTPQIPQLDGATPKDRTYAFTTIDLMHIKQIAKRFDGTVNDAVMTVLGGAVRSYLMEIGALDELGDQSVIALVPRSLREKSDGDFGNFITMILPTLGTNIEDPRERFSAIKQSMRAEIQRSQLLHESVSTFEKPFTARKRLRPEVGTSAGNLSISNVPGPDSERWFGGYKVLSNFPTPSLVAGQFLNVTIRRYCDSLHLGLMSDPTKINDLDTVVNAVQSSVNEAFK